MNSIIAIVLLVILLIILVFLLKTILPAFSKFISGLPKGIFIILLLGILGVMSYLVIFLVNTSQYGGMMSNSTPTSEGTDATEEEVITEKIDNCIILRDNNIWIDNEIVDADAVNAYIDERVVNNIEITIVDDYSMASLHHEITDLCKKKGVNFKTENEKWLEQ